MLLPLHCYDEAGRVKPPVWLYWMLILLCSDWLALVFALLTFGKTSDLLALLYPERGVLGVRLLATLPFVCTLLLLGNRERLWKRQWIEWRKLILPLLVSGIAASVWAQVNTMQQDHWAFHWTPALFLAGNFVLVITLMKSLHVSTMLADWRYREEGADTPGMTTEADDSAPVRNSGPD